MASTRKSTVSLGVWSPTFSVYEAFRDYGSVRNADWVADYFHPALRRASGEGDPDSVFNRRGASEEIRWRHDFRTWMMFVNDFKNRGGLVTAGSDAGYYWTTYGFSFVRNLELLEEAGFTPLETIRAATLDSAKWLRIDHETGSVEIGKRADLVVTDLNPLENIRVLYATGVPGKDEQGRLTHIGGVRYVVRAGVVYDPKTVLANVKSLVRDASGH